MSSKGNGDRPDVSSQQKSALLLLFITFFIDILGFGLVLTLSPYYVQEFPTLFGRRIGAGLAVGLLTACYPILQLICAPYWGRLSDRVGRRPIILLSLLGNAMAWLLFGLARSLEVLFLARMLSGVLSSASLPTVQAYIADCTPPAKRSVWIGIVVGMGFSFGFMLGPPVGGLLATSPWPARVNTVIGWLPGGQAIISGNHLSYPAYLAAGIAFLNFLAALWRLPESLSPELRVTKADQREGIPFRQLARAMREPVMGTLLLILGLSTFAMQTFEQNLTLFGSKDVTATVRETSWNQINPEFIAGHEIYSIRYAPQSAPPASALPAIRSALSSPAAENSQAIGSDQSIQNGDVVMKRHLIERDTGEILGVVALIVGLIQGGGLRKLIPRVGEVRLVTLGCLITALGLFLMPEARSLWLLFGAASITAVGSSFINPCLRGLVSQETAATSQGSVLGISESVRGFAMAIGPLVGGWLFDLGGWIPFVLAGVCMLGGVALTMRLGSTRGLSASAQPAVH
ncbi:MAG: MFS transporter [Chloroflexi bacterium]|nr:MFS transporter [Chloroflexota bacterium]